MPDKPTDTKQAAAENAPGVRSSDLFCAEPPDDGRDYDCQCARCGSSMSSETCECCGGSGCTEPGELYEQDPLWYDMEDVEACNQCGGEGGWHVCLSSPEWCEANPLKGREQVKRGAVEWYPLPEAQNDELTHRRPKDVARDSGTEDAIGGCVQ